MLCIFKAKFHWKSISFALIRPMFLTFSNRSYQLLFQQQHAQEMNQWQSIRISWPVPSFSQHNWRLVVSGRCLHVSVTKFQDTFARLQQVNSPNSWNKFQICCTDMYLIRFLPNFAVFFVFLWISRDFADLPEFRGSATARNIRSPVSCWKKYFSTLTLEEKFCISARPCNILYVCILMRCQKFPAKDF